MVKDYFAKSGRMKALINREKLDRIPVMPNSGLHGAAISNLTAREFYLEPEKAMWAQLWARELYQDDGAPSYAFTTWGGWDFGGEIKIPEAPSISTPVITKYAIEKPQDVESLQIPDLNTAPALNRILQFSRLSRARGGGVSIPVFSPMGTAAVVIGPERFLRWVYKEPELVHRVTRLVTDYILQVADLFVTEFGVEACTVSTAFPVESHAMISPKVFERFSLPYIKEVFDKLRAKGLKNWSVHLCGDHTKNLHYWAEEITLEPRTIITMGYENDIEQVAKTFGDEMVIGGNIPAYLMQVGTPEEIIESCRAVIEKMKYYPGGFFLTPDCGLPPLTPPINVHALVKAANIFGRYD
nr:uroporphyrinogen decarboxylase family protein [Sedimentibacter sp.]